ncbi:MAG: polysaccharide biosynthesis/export family protein, partial [Synergistaceae bacterium]|nr:polysaccharide biosynthesis/export family protein [Synergistaceae bacterium]
MIKFFGVILLRTTKFLTSAIIVLALASCAFGADAGGPAVLAAPSPQLALPSSPGLPSTQTAPSTQAPDANAVDLSGLDSTQPTTRTQTENIDTTGNEAQAETQALEGQDATGNPNVQNLDSEITETEVNNYFDEILSSTTTTGNPMGNLFRRLPRYGMSFFRRPPSTYAPRESVPVTQGYRIGVGDEMTLTIWGIPEEGNFRFGVNRDGMAAIPHIGMVRLAGYTIAEAERIISARLSQYYTGFQMNLSMGRLSSIMIYVTGNAARPGAYTVSSFSTLVNALIASGGPSGNGTLRNIELKRDGRTVAVFDMYAMLLQGDKTQ